MQDNSSKLFKQRLQRVHVSVGITVSILMYISIFFGIFAIFLPYIQTWENPSRHFALDRSIEINYTSILNSVLKEPDYPQNNIIIDIPFENFDKDFTIKIKHQFAKTKVFNPYTFQEIEDNLTQSNLAWFLNSMHYGRPFKVFGFFIFGLVAVSVIFLLVGGLIQVIIFKYKNNPKNVQGKFSKWHRKIFIWLFFPFFMIVFNGALLNMGYKSKAYSLITYISLKDKTSEIGKYTRPFLNPEKKIKKRQNIKKEMIPLSFLLKKAQKINPNLVFYKMIISNWNDKSAQVEFIGMNPKWTFINNIYNKPTVILSAVNGNLIKNIKVFDAHWTKIFVDSMYFLHFLAYLDFPIRFIVSLIMGLCGLAIGFGVLLWLEKKAKKIPVSIPVYQGMGKLSLATMIGVIPATGLLFVLQWLLPFEMENRVLIQKGLFATFWMGTLAWSFYRINSYQTAKEFLKIGGFLFFISPFIHFYNSNFSPIRLWNENMINILGVDIGLFLFGIILFYIGIKLPSSRESVNKFWIKII